MQISSSLIFHDIIAKQVRVIVVYIVIIPGQITLVRIMQQQDECRHGRLILSVNLNKFYHRSNNSLQYITDSVIHENIANIIFCMIIFTLRLERFHNIIKISLAVFIIFPKLYRNTFQYPLSKRVKRKERRF